MAQRKRYAIVGTGGRAEMYVEALTRTFADTNELVALCDLSATRMAYYNRQIAEARGAPVPAYVASDFDRMVTESRPDVVIVTSMDSTHHQYIVRAMQLGCDAITEKPMTIDAAKANAIFDAIAATGKQLRVTFNYRYAPLTTKVRELLMQGVVGRPLHVNFQWVLDTFHGADYFRRWHREKDKSGGLLVHKATHHFDAINWWIQSYPANVFAMGDLLFYGRANATRRGENYTYTRYTGEDAAAQDPFSLVLDQDDEYRGLYLDAEPESGYLRDRNVFGDNITIEDAMSITARYRNQVVLTYSLVAFSPWEGYRVAISGDKGRLELDVVDQVGREFTPDGEQRFTRAAGIEAEFGGTDLRVYPIFGRPYRVEIPKGEGGHGGGDKLMLADLFAPESRPDPFGRAATHIDGAASILLGIAANQSMATGLPVHVDDLLRLP